MATDSRTLLITWRPPPLSAQNGIITEYVVNITAMETGEQLQQRATGAASSISIDSLHPDYTYAYSVAAVTAVGMGPFSAFRSTRLPEDGKEANYSNGDSVKNCWIKQTSVYLWWNSVL